MTEVICKHGFINQLISDRGSQFVSHVMNKVYKILKTRKVNKSSWNPRANGHTERFNQPLRNMLAIYCDKYQRDWDKHLPYLMFAYNTATHEATKLTPFFMLYGHEARYPIETSVGGINYTGSAYGTSNITTKVRTKFQNAMEIVKKNQELAQHKMILHVDKRRTPATYLIGDCVW